jgi:hypothetical protein
MKGELVQGVLRLDPCTAQPYGVSVLEGGLRYHTRLER